MSGPYLDDCVRIGVDSGNEYREKGDGMRKALFVLITVVVLVVATAGSALAASGPVGPAPNSGDCIPDGSGFDGPNGPCGSVDGGVGPAPNSGDGIPDGSGF